MNANERLEQLLGACPWGVFVVNMDRLTEDGWHDITHLVPGRIIRAVDVDAVRFIPTGDNPMLGCVAGWLGDPDDE